jgi:hypothetical protein
MNAPLASNEVPRPVKIGADVIGGAVVLAIRAAALVLFLGMAMAEPILAVGLCGMALACFSVAVLFGFILPTPFHHRWFVLGASIVFLGAYLLFRWVMLALERLMR